ncbi:MAG: hypothetical protein ACI857_002584 [Arenicella sp.]
MKITGIPDQVIYVRREDTKRGSGSGVKTKGKMLSSVDLSTCYLDIIDKSTICWEDKYGEDATYQTYYEHKICFTKISSEGIEVTYNNSCGDHHSDTNEDDQGFGDPVLNLEEGKYLFKEGIWRLQL